MSSFIEFLGHRLYSGVTVMQAFNPVEIAAPTHTQRVKGNPRHTTTETEYKSYINRYNEKAQVYVGLNPVKPDQKGFPTDKDVLVWCNELLDLDLEKPKLIDEDVTDGYPKEYKHYAAREADLKKLEPFIDKINKWLTDHGFKNGYQDHTGNGYRWILPVPGLDLTGHDLTALAAKKREFKEQIVRECDIVDGCGVHLDSVFDFRRITGVPGTLNFKLETPTRKNRIREPFRGMERDEDVALRDHILNIELPKEIAHTPHEVTASASLEYWIGRDEKLKRLYEGDISGYESRSNAEYALCTKLAFYGFTENEAENIMLSAGIGKAAEKKKGGHDAYITKTVRKAFSAQTERIQEKKTAGTGFNVSPDAFLVGDKQAFDANRFAKWLIDASGFTFVTLSDTDVVMWYSGGVYLPAGEVEIRKIVERMMDGFKVTTHTVNEVIGHIKRRTYVERDDFDKDKRIINLQNGLFDTRTRKLMPHIPTYLSTVRVPVAYDPAATCPKIDRFLSEVLDADDIETLIEWFGYVLEPDYWIEAILMFLGEGGNGKSTVLNLMSAFIGKRNVANESIHNLTNHRFRVANLYGKLINIHADISDKELSETGMMKLLSGKDRITVEQKGKPPFEFENFARLIFSANRLPRSRDDTDAWYRRWVFVTFTRKFGKDPDAVKEADRRILDKLTTESELSGMLNHALKALNGLHERGGFSRNISTEETRKIYTRLSDPVAVFIEDCCMIDQRATVAKSTFFNTYVEFCKVNRQAPIGQAAFTRRINDMGKFSECKVGGKGDQVRGWRGLNIDESILDSRGKPLGSTLWSEDEPLTSGAGSTVSTLLKPLLQNYGKKDGNGARIAEKGKKSVLTVLPAPTDTDSLEAQSVLPSGLPDKSTDLSFGVQVMQLICEHVQKYGREDDRSFNLIRARIEDVGHDPELVSHCIKRYREGHRIFVPRQVSA